MVYCYPGGTIELLLWQALKLYPTEALFSFLVDKSYRVRMAAARELQIRGEKVAFEWAKKLLGARAAYKREIAVFLLGQLGTPNYPYREESLPLLKEAWHDPHIYVRTEVIRSLGHLRAIELIDLILEAACDQDAGIRTAAAVMLDANRFRDPRAEQALIKLRNDPDEKVRYWAEDWDEPDHVY
jgi:HEAT repeat protein